MAIGAFAGWAVTWSWHRVRRASDRIDAILLGVRHAEITHGLHQPVPGDPNPPIKPSLRRSPNEQLVWRPAEPRRSPRPVFHEPHDV